MSAELSAQLLIENSHREMNRQERHGVLRMLCDTDARVGVCCLCLTCLLMWYSHPLAEASVAGTALEKERPVTALEEESPVPVEIWRGLMMYQEVFDSYDPKLMPEVLHPSFAMSGFANESDVNSFEVFDYAKMIEICGPIHRVKQKLAPVSSLSPMQQALLSVRLVDATNVLRHYRLGPNVYVTEIGDKHVDADGEVVFAYHTNLHWIHTPQGFRIKDKIYATIN